MQNFFYGWYLKCQSDKQALAIIPSIHQSKEKRFCSIQMITEEETFSARFSGCTFYQASKNGKILKPVKNRKLVIGENIFCDRGMKLAINRPGFEVEGKLWFRELTPLKYDIMGPFAWVPFMECRHSVYSMAHEVSGVIFLNGKRYTFREAEGYWEGDRGRSFPKEYLWTQCLFDGGSLMLSVAEIPFGSKSFTGIIGVVLWQGEEYRFATYLGAKVRWLGNGMVWIVQGDMEFKAQLLEWNAKEQDDDFEGRAQNFKKELQAPVNGEMARMIHENVTCHASYLFRKGDEVYLNFETQKASFEYEYL